MAKVKLKLFGKSREKRVAQAATIKTALTGNATFPTPNPSLATYGSAITASQTKLATYKLLRTQMEAALADLDDQMAVLDGYTTQLGAYVESVSAGNKVKIESAGMDARADRAPITLTRVLDLVLSEGDDDGSLDIFWKPMRGAGCYEIWLCASNPGVEANWLLKQTSSSSRARLTHLTSGQKVWARVRAIGGRNQRGAFSDPATKTVP